MKNLQCLLCDNDETELILESDLRFHDIRRFYHCKSCDLVFVHPDDRLDGDMEFSRYVQHDNRPYDPEYRKFLSQLANPMLKRIKPNSCGLDFGSGPGPALHLMFEEKGHRMQNYDIFFDDDPTVFEEMYDFITVSETAEHLFDPLSEFDRLWSCLKEGGYLGIMTSQAPENDQLEDWHYIYDDTHVVFFRPKTFAWMAKRWDADLEILSDRVVIFRKK